MALSKVLIVVVTLLAKRESRADEAAVAEECPKTRQPYSNEPSPFGWPLTPADWHWSHTACWDKPHGGYVSCGGVAQSPMNIDTSKSLSPGGKGAGSLHGAASYASVVSPTVEISPYLRSVYISAPPGVTLGSINLESDVGPVVYDAFQVHLTAASLHSVNGKHFDAELTVLHRPRNVYAPMDFVAVSVLFKHDVKKSSPVFSQMGFVGGDETLLQESRESVQPRWAAPGTNGDGVVDFASVIAPALKGNSWFYNGSVPVPPCSETVKWFVLETALPVSKTQTDYLHQLLRTWANSRSELAWKTNNKRSPVPRGNRAIALNSLTIGGRHDKESCDSFTDAQKANAAVCWEAIEPKCGQGSQSPEMLFKAAANVSKIPETLTQIVNYKIPTPNYESVKVTPAKYSLNVMPVTSGGFGNIMLHGRVFEVRTIKIKAIAQHIIEGERFPAELVIEHSMFGDDVTDPTVPDYAPVEHIVMLTVPIKIGRESTLLRQIGLGASVYEETIRDGNEYHPFEQIDLMEGLEEPLKGNWFWYNGSRTEPDCRESVKWIALETPIEANIEQINFLALEVPGMESTRRPQSARATVDPHVYLNHLPTHAVQIDRFCPDPSVPFSYLNTHCWNTCTLGCSSICSEGVHQSPIDIATATVDKVKRDNFLHICSWRPISRAHVVNTGHSLVVANQQMGYITLIGEDGFPAFYHVVQFNIHMPSEHMINGKQYHGELHVVHAKQISNEELDYSDVLITAIMLDIGDKESPLLKQLMFPDHTRSEPLYANEFGVSDHPIDLMRALGPVIDGPFYTYKGSLTTPPCREVVKWLVFENVQSMTKEQWVHFKTKYANPANNRPVQPVNERRLSKNSFDTPDEDKSLLTFDYWGGRDYGHNRRDPGAAWILLPIICALLLCCGVMVVTLVREDTRRKSQAAGGLTSETVGKGAYQTM